MRRTHERVASVTRRSRSRAEPAPGLARGQGCGGRRAGQPIRPAGGCKPHNSMFRNRGRPDWGVEACRQDVDGREHRASQRKCPGSLAEGWPRGLGGMPGHHGEGSPQTTQGLPEEVPRKPGRGPGHQQRGLTTQAGPWPAPGPPPPTGPAPLTPCGALVS